MNKIEARIDFLSSEIKKCEDLQSAASSLCDALKRIKDKFISCSDNLAAGGFTIDGSGVDVSMFGGYNGFVEKNVTPVIDDLSSLTSNLATTILKYDTELTNKKSELERQKRLQTEAEDTDEGNNNAGPLITRLTPKSLLK